MNRLFVQATAEQLLTILERRPQLAPAIVRHPNMTATRATEALLKLGRWRRSEALRQTAMPAALLDELARRGDAEVRRQLATAPAVAEATLHWLFEHADATVRLEILHRPNPAAKLLAAARHDPCERVRLRLASHPSAEAALLHQLARDPEPLHAASTCPGY